ncbi:unnamed protein product [Owenia fusiformis]|uniref:Uncharacterized protein n=1 Tax=Owenia fusiformis TaxID=6347 RepID=A0A8J1TI05_OWEFU|nr:unnamed protein product [Owenia fusiformis]
MSSLKKMSVMGIRSFGADDTQKQIIEFFYPLTLILGPNGTGKTTVIEALKYITTGEFPPGSKTNGAFVHDPKIAGESMVRAQIRLAFQDVMGQAVVCQRSIEATQKAKSVSTKTLDGTITRKGADGEKNSISSRCTEINSEMITLLGVSKSVLENVIFCHQEESNWPLSEGKALKQKFDDIFASSRYVKALESLMKTKKELAVNVKEYKIEIQFLKANKDMAEKINDELKELETKQKRAEDSIKGIDEKLAPINERLEQYHKQFREIYAVQTEITKKESTKKEMLKNVQSLRDNLVEEFPGSTEELKRRLQDFEKQGAKKEKELTQCQQEEEQLTIKLEKNNKRKQKYLIDQGRLKQEEETYRQNIRSRDARVTAFAQEYNLQGYDDSAEYTQAQIKQYSEDLRSLLRDIQKNEAEVKAKYESKEDDVQKELDKTKHQRATLEGSIKIKKDMLEKNVREIKQVNRKLQEVDESADRLDDITRELQQTEREIAQAERAVDLVSLKQEISNLTKQKKELDEQFNNLSAEMSRMHMESKARTEVEMLKKEKKTEEDSIKRLKAKHDDSFKHLLTGTPNLQTIKRTLEQKINQNGRDVRDTRAKLEKANKQLNIKETQRKYTKDELNKKKVELNGHQEKMYEVGGSGKFEECLQNIEARIDKAQDERAQLVGASAWFKRYISKMNIDQLDEIACPVCKRGFEEMCDVRDVIAELQQKLDRIPLELKSKEEELMGLQQRKDKMVELRPLRNTMKKLEETEIPNLETRVANIEEDIKKVNEEIAEYDETQDSYQLDKTMLESMHPDIIILDKSFYKVQDLERKINQASAKLSGGDSSRTMEQVNEEKDQVQENKETVELSLERKRKKERETTERITNLRTAQNKLGQEKLQIDSELQQRNNLVESKVEMEKANVTYKQEIRDAQTAIEPINEEIDRLHQMKEEIKHEKDSFTELEKEKFNKAKEKGQQIGALSKNIQRYMEEGKAEQLEEITDKITELSENIENFKQGLDELKEVIDKLRKDLASQQVSEREIKDNLEMRMKQEDIKKVEAAIKDLKDKIGDFDPDNLEKNKADLEQQADEFFQQRQRHKERQVGFEEMVKSKKKDLKSDVYNDIETRYRDKNIDVRTTELAMDDVFRYYRALDAAINNYHRTKMAEINKIIRELWRNTYRGNDIDTIEIRSEDDGAGGLTATKTRRTYNYRVVMLKGTTTLDMRGRCSAGQKVLSSLIIRLALAETFCLKCGILTLDEPTTNLDRENIESLAYALVEIIKARSKQKNFQLIIITHDEDFVELLGKSEYVDYFYKMKKDNDGLSRCVKSRVQDIGQHLH